MLMISALAGALLAAQAMDKPAAGKAPSSERAIGWVSLRYQRTNGRMGPGKDYAIAWEYHRRGLPMEVLRRSSEWTRVRDFDGDVVWMHNAVLRQRATALVIAGAPVNLRTNNKRRLRVIARLAPGVQVRVLDCDPTFCLVRVKDLEGRMAKNRLWGNVSVKAQ